MFNECLVYNKYGINFYFIYLSRNCLLIFLICKIFKRKKILLAKKYIDVEDEEIANTIKRHIAINILE